MSSSWALLRIQADPALRSWAATLLVIVGLLFCSMQGSAAQGVAKQAKVAILSPFSPPEPGIEAFVRELTDWVGSRVRTCRPK